MASSNINMDAVEALHVALQQSFSPDASVRDPAEAAIKISSSCPGRRKCCFTSRRKSSSLRTSYLGVALSSADGATNPDGTPQKSPLLSEEDKAIVKQKLIECLLSEPDKSICDLMAETVHSISIHDFPASWPELLPVLLNAVSMSSDPSQGLRVHNALLALRKLPPAPSPRTAPLGPQRTEPRGGHDAQANSQDILELYAVLPPRGPKQSRWIGHERSSPALANPDAMGPWFDVLRAVLAKHLPEESQPASKEERNAWPWWKCKKWAAQIMTRLFSRYGIPSYAEEEVKEFAKYFSQNVAPQFLGPVCETLNLRPSGQFCTDRVVHYCLNFVDLAVELADTYKLLKPHMEFLLYKVCFPAMCLTEEDIQEFENDPHEFVHKQNSPLADFYDPRMSAITLVTSAVKYRPKDIMQPLLGFLTEILTRYNTTEEASRNHIEKDCALLVFGSLSEILLAKKKYASELEGLMVSSVFPDFNSQIGFLRCRACWMVQRFSNTPWSDDGTHLRTLTQLVLQRLSDPALPVQIEASKALRYLIEVDGTQVHLLPVLPHILNEYFRIMSEIGNDEVVVALQVIIDTFGEHIEPHAVALVTQLSSAFSNYIGAGEEDDDAAMAAAQCLECINTVLKGTCEHPEIYKGMEAHLIPLILMILGHDGEYLEYAEFALDTLTFLTYFPQQLSPELWKAFPLVYHSFQHWAFDYLCLMTPPLNNFISKDPQYFLTGKGDVPDVGPVPYIDMIFNMVSKAVQDDRTSESEARKSLTLYMSVLHNCTGQVDNYLPTINDIVLRKLGQQVNAEIPLTRHVIFQVLGSALYYNPQLELAELEKRGVTHQVFSQWEKDLGGMDKWLSKKLTVLGFSSILRIPASSLPQNIVPLLPSIITTVVRVAEEMKEEVEKGHTEDDDGAIEAEDEGDDDWEGFEENEDVTNVHDVAYMSALNKLSAAGDVSQFLLGGDDWDDELDDDEDYHSPIDNVDELHFMNDVLREAFQREPEVYQQLQAALPHETVVSFQKLMAAVDAQRSQAGPAS
ncbi:hypothetical protein HJC23_000039 [Cyclotella cryptica]|uniref:Exportin-2 central domain-containing protein n=1 Tax=Cyclotella cryptica TaxID=29204 RepID=A0ABD3NTV4_9STRA